VPKSNQGPRSCVEPSGSPAAALVKPLNPRNALRPKARGVSSIEILNRVFPLWSEGLSWPLMQGTQAPLLAKIALRSIGVLMKSQMNRPQAPDGRTPFVRMS